MNHRRRRGLAGERMERMERYVRRRKAEACCNAALQNSYRCFAAAENNFLHLGGLNGLTMKLMEPGIPGED